MNTTTKYTEGELSGLIQKELRDMRGLRTEFSKRHGLAADPDTDQYLILQALLEYNREWRRCERSDQERA